VASWDRKESDWYTKHFNKPIRVQERGQGTEVGDIRHVDYESLISFVLCEHVGCSCFNSEGLSKVDRVMEERCGV